MTDIERHKQIVREHFDLVGRGQYMECLKDFASDAEWWVIGTGVHGGSHSMQDLIEAYSGPVPNYFPDGNPVTLVNLIAEGDWVVAQGHSANVTTTGIGAPYRNEYVWMFKIVDGKVRIFREYFDTLHAEEKIFGRTLI
jgi:ketosteroid isomerase-like protein